MAQPQSSNQPSTFRQQPFSNNYGHINHANCIASSQNDGRASNIHLRNRSVLRRPKCAADSDAASSGGRSVTASLRWGVRRKRNSAEVRKSAVVSLWIASVLGRDNLTMREAILNSCMKDVGPAELQSSMRARLLPLSDKFVQSHTLAVNDCSLAGLQCLAALARNASPDVQGRVAFRLRKLVKKATMLTPLSRKCLIFSLLAVQESQITQVASSIVGAWYDLCMDFLKNSEGDAGFSVECAKALMNMIMNPNSSSDLRTQSVTSLLNMVNVSPHVCAYMGDPYLLRQLLDCQKPEWGVGGRAIADLRKENADLRKANADLRKKVAKRYNKA